MGEHLLSHTTDGTRQVDAERLIDESPISRFQILVGILCTAVIFVDGFNNQVIGYILPALAKDWHLSKATLGTVAASSQLGTFLGLILVAPLSTKWGYRKLMIVGTAAFGLITIIAASAGSIEALIGLRFLTGIGLGAVLPNAQTMNGEFFPRRKRSTMVLLGGCGVTIGSLAAGAVAGFLLHRVGWRGVLVIGGSLSVLVAGILVFLLPDSLDYLVTRKRDQGAARALARRIARAFPEDDGVVVTTAMARRSGSLLDLFRGGYAVGTIGIWVAYACNHAVHGFMQNWMAVIIVDSGHTQSIAIAATSVMVAGGLFSVLVFGPLMDRFLPYKVVGAGYVAGAGLVALLGSLLSHAIWLIMLTAFVAGFVVSGIQKCLNALAVYYYPAAIRPTGLSWGIGSARIGQTSAPLLAGALLQTQWQPSSLFYLAAIPMLVGAGAMIVMWRRYGGGNSGGRERLRPQGSAPAVA